MTTGHEPLDTLKPIAPEVWLIDGPAIRFYGMPFSTRATVVRLLDGSVWVHSPTRLTEALAGKVAALGPVAHLVAPNWIHYAYVDDWHARFPRARRWAAPGVAERARAHGMTGDFDADLAQDAPDPWAGEIDQMIVRGSDVHREAVFFHRASRTLILTDLIENFEPDQLPWLMRPLARLGGIVAPHGSMPRDMRMTFRKHRDLLREDVERMIDWAPRRVVLAHGMWFETDAVAALRRAFGWLLRD